MMMTVFWAAALMLLGAVLAFVVLYLMILYLEVK